MGVHECTTQGHSHEHAANDYGDAPTPISPNDESRPFLNEDLEDAIKLEPRHEDTPTRRHGVTPLPKAQLATLCAVRLVDPIMFTQIFPYVNEMMDHLHLTEDRSKTGLYSGLVVCAYIWEYCPFAHFHVILRSTTGKQLCCRPITVHLSMGPIVR